MKKGTILWRYDKSHVSNTDLMSVFAGQFVHDLNGDNVSDILAVHGGDELSDPKVNSENLFGRVILFNGKTGQPLRWIPTPDRRESYYPPQILTWLDGEQYALFGTGASTRGGSLYVISSYELYKGDISKVTTILLG